MGLFDRRKKKKVLIDLDFFKEMADQVSSQLSDLDAKEIAKKSSERLQPVRQSLRRTGKELNANRKQLGRRAQSAFHQVEDNIKPFQDDVRDKWNQLRTDRQLHQWKKSQKQATDAIEDQVEEAKNELQQSSVKTRRRPLRSAYKALTISLPGIVYLMARPKRKRRK